ncbi:hypothetical protein CWIS_01225 [Cellulomonas sp. A375-1]|uniref:DUF72 domain-containing protein n=1 Tax=Cellulomonas sp. A375-1 TaxID=1672219 RepID=UPI0006526D17|nr:DUF72 domain-containing protein [Cellulomonas sp. A375-1]KMM47174.1 hypothetical protein CWIS_01225 [Cellulomonas sp. A375-1]
MTVRVGISGWRYAPWRGVFYPPGLPQRLELPYAAQRLTSIEVNGSFYALQRPASYQAWAEQVPDEFVLSVKGPRFVTHMKKLAHVRTPVANFLASGVLALGPRLGPLLWQLPPTLGFDADRLAGFFALLPRTTGAAAALAAEHDERLDGRAWTTTDADRPLRHVLEVRHRSFADPAFVALAREHGIGVVVADTAGRWPVLEDVTSDVVYVRLHGDRELYTSGYDEPAIVRWADRVRAWSAGGEPADARRLGPPAAPAPAGRDVFVYFDNDTKVRAPFDAQALISRLRALDGSAEAP